MHIVKQGVGAAAQFHYKRYVISQPVEKTLGCMVIKLPSVIPKSMTVFLFYLFI